MTVKFPNERVFKLTSNKNQCTQLPAHIRDHKMNKVLLDLSRKCRTWLVENPGPDGRKKIAAYLEQLLTDQGAIDNLVPMTTGERDLLYQDPDLGFCILAHNYSGPKTVPPHDHGPSWAIYAQVRGETEMRE